MPLRFVIAGHAGCSRGVTRLLAGRALAPAASPRSTQCASACSILGWTVVGVDRHWISVRQHGSSMAHGTHGAASSVDDRRGSSDPVGCASDHAVSRPSRALCGRCAGPPLAKSDGAAVKPQDDPSVALLARWYICCRWMARFLLLLTCY